MGNNENYGKMFYDKFKENISNKLKKNPKDYFNNQKCTETAVCMSISARLNQKRSSLHP